MMKIKLTGDVKGFESEIVLAQTCLDRLDEGFSSATLRNVSESMLAELIDAARKERRRREVIKRLYNTFCDVIGEARASGIDLVDVETGEVVTDKSFTLC